MTSVKPSIAPAALAATFVTSSVISASVIGSPGVGAGTHRIQVIDRQSGEVVGQYQSKRRARNRRDALDLQYGAVRYMVREVPA
ncbi:hypothetical protein O4H66_17175 [Comamonadaceae bacterium G21597-S1]|nr:hypothetical protein [Comamonadaceae bacterium G21597-S1]